MMNPSIPPHHPQVRLKWLPIGLNLHQQKKRRITKNRNRKSGSHPIIFSDPFRQRPLFHWNLFQNPSRIIQLMFSQRYQCPPDMIAIPLIVSTAGLIGRMVSIRPKQNDNWAERACLWGIVIANKGSMKSPALAEATKNIRRVQDRLEKEYRQKLREWRKQNDDSEKNNEPQVESEGEIGKEAEPKQKRIIVTDTTVEKVLDIMRFSRGLTMIHDELAAFALNMSKYNKGSERQIYLQTHSGGSYNVDRIGRGEQYVDDLYLNIVGLIQPSVAQVIFGEDAG